MKDKNEEMFLGGERYKIKIFEISSIVLKAEYDSVLNRMKVWFVNGNSYEYYGIPKEIVREFFDSKSAGSFLNLRIRNIFPFKKL